MFVQNNVVMGLIQAELHKRFGPGWSIDVLEAPDEPYHALVRLRYGHVGGDGSVAVNARMLLMHLPNMVEAKSVQEQVYEAIGDEWSPPFYLTRKALNTCQYLYDHVMEHRDHYAWTEQNDPA